MAKKGCTASSVFLQEISKDFEPISQRELEDLRKAKRVIFSEALRATHEWHARLEDNLAARLQAGVPVEIGPLTAREFGGIVLVSDQNENKEAE